MREIRKKTQETKRVMGKESGVGKEKTEEKGRKRINRDGRARNGQRRSRPRRSRPPNELRSDWLSAGGGRLPLAAAAALSAPIGPPACPVSSAAAAAAVAADSGVEPAAGCKVGVWADGGMDGWVD